jgi:predicted RNA-binding protein
MPYTIYVYLNLYINIEGKVINEDNVYMAVEGDGKAEIESDMTAAH